MSLNYRVLVNSLPKSGTHLLAKAVNQLGYQEYRRKHPDLPWLLNHHQAKQGRKSPMASWTDNIQIGALTEYAVNPATLHDWLSQLTLGQYIQGHLPFNADIPPILEDLNFRHLLIVRDPRSVLVSLLQFIPTAYKTDMGAHFLADDFAQLSQTQQLTLLLNGGYAPLAGVQIVPFAHVFNAFLAWQSHPTCLLLRFEDLIGEQGGGHTQAQQQALVRIAEHLGLESPSLADVYDPHSRTFRKGKIDGWTQGLEPEKIEQIETYCAPLCSQLDV